MRILPPLLGLVLALPAAAPAVTLDLVTVGDPGNACDNTVSGCWGAVAATFQMGRYEVTNAQYAEFLNAVAASDVIGLWNPNMASSFGGILRSGSAGSYSYAPVSGRADMPVNFVSVYDAMRFCNWLHNGQPSGPPGTSTTEDGAYTITQGGIGANSIVRNAGALFFLPDEDEWHKAAYYDGVGGWFDYPTPAFVVPTCDGPTATPHRANCGNAVGDTTDVGSYTGTPSPYFTFDQAGNAREWTESKSGAYRVMRGGAFNASNADFEAAARLLQNPTGELNSMGFRVAASSSAPAVPLAGPWALLATALLLAGSAGLRLRTR